MVGRLVHGPRGGWCSFGWPEVAPGAMVVVRAVAGGPPGGRELLTSGFCGSPGRFVDPTRIVDPTGAVDAAGMVDATGNDDAVVTVRTVGSGPTLVGLDELRCRSRSSRPTSLGVSGAGRAVVTSSATRSIAALTPSTINVVAATHVPSARSQRLSTTRVCDGSSCAEVKQW